MQLVKKSECVCFFFPIIKLGFPNNISEVKSSVTISSLVQLCGPRLLADKIEGLCQKFLCIFEFHPKNYMVVKIFKQIKI